ncbi:MAG: molybdopterin-binding protein [Actinomycetaceae bacterium]|nr:molybdopterin-binding protein [Actinomycetaceae bacterium]
MAPEWNPKNIRPGIVVVSDRILAGQRPNAAAEQCVERLLAEGLVQADISVVAEAQASIEEAIGRALHAGRRLILVLGGSGFRAGNDSPEAARAFIDVELPGVAEHIRAHGLTHTPRASLSRGVVGLTGRQPGAALIVTSPGSTGGSQDTLDVVLPLLESIYSQLDEV